MKRINELLTLKTIFLLCLVLFIGINEIKFTALCHSDNALSHNSILMNINEIDNVGDIEILGNWYGQLPDGDKGDKDITLKITNYEVMMDWVDSTIGDVTSNIIRYDNGAKIAMLQIVEHPDVPHQEGMYMKTTWTIVSQNQITVSWYMPQSTEGDAEDDTYPAYGTYTYTRSITSTITSSTTTTTPADTTTTNAWGGVNITNSCSLCDPASVFLVCGSTPCGTGSVGYGETWTVDVPTGSVTIVCSCEHGIIGHIEEVFDRIVYDNEWTDVYFGCLADEWIASCIGLGLYGKASEEVNVLRHFRDSILSQSPEGREIIKLYYQWSPTIVRAMEADEEFKEEVKEMIDGVLFLISGEIE